MSAPAARPAQASSRGELVLLVDDSASQRAVIAYRLQQIGYRVTAAGDGHECLELLGQIRPDIVLLDVVMPELDGWDTLDRIREMSGVPVIMLTARAEDVERIRGLRAGADDYVAKPFHQDELEARIGAVLRRSEQARRDGLTGLPNRRAFDEHLDSLFGRSRVDELALVLFDLDHFKQINDRLGHPEGDRVLREVARVALREVRADEELFRVGGEEFAIVIFGGHPAAIAVAERVRTAVARQHRNGSLPTLSAGVAACPHDATTKEGLVQQADLALYAAKEGGRNRVASAGLRRWPA